MARLLCLTLWLGLLATPALAADPIMPLDQVHRGMECEGRTVIRGTAIETFDVEILDVLRNSGTGSTAEILFRASGPAVDQTGLGFGFSGSPIYCPDGEGLMRNAGAVYAGVEDYGNDVALATPIEAILSLPVGTPAHARAATDTEREARPWTGPLTIAGAGPGIRAALWSAAARHGLQLINAPASAAQGETGDLRPGSSLAVAISSGAVAFNGIGSVAYRDDASRVWGFGHAFDGAGTRSLLLQGAFVHHVVGNPNPPAFNLGTYKLASPGEILGTIDFDGNFAVSGTLGALPATIPVLVDARGPAGDPLPRSITQVADESPLNHPSGLAALSLVTSVAVSDRVLRALGSSGGRSYGRMCMRIEIAERDRPMRFCNRYAGNGQFPGATEIAMAGDAASAAGLVEHFDRAQLHVERVRATLAVEEELRFARLRGARAPKRARAGERIPVRIRYQRPREELMSSTFSVRVPKSLEPGRHVLRLQGAGPDPGEASLEGIFAIGLSSDDFLFFFGGGPRAPGSVEKLADAVAAIHRYDGIRASFSRGREPRPRSFDPFGIARPRDGRRAFRHDELRIGGSEKLRIRVLRR